MCGPAFPWEWFILDVAYVLALLGGAMILRAKGSLPITWVAFGILSFSTGTFLFAATLGAQAAYGEAVATASVALQPCGP